MIRSTTKRSVFILIILNIILFSALIMPLKKKRIHSPTVVLKEITNPSDHFNKPFKNVKNIDPEGIAIAFGWKKHSNVKNDTVKKVRLEEADWIKPLGYAVKDDGKKYFIFKDMEVNAVFSLAVGDKKGIWRLLGMDDKWYIIELGSKTYKVRKINN